MYKYVDKTNSILAGISPFSALDGVSFTIPGTLAGAYETGEIVYN